MKGLKLFPKQISPQIQFMYNHKKTAAAATAAAKSLQSCPTLCNPIDGSLPGSPVPGILQARVLEWGATAFSDKKTMDYLLLCELFIAKWTYSLQKLVNYKLALAKGICYLPLRRLDPVLMQLLTFRTPWRELSMENEVLRAPGKLVEQVFR